MSGTRASFLSSSRQEQEYSRQRRSLEGNGELQKMEAKKKCRLAMNSVSAQCVWIERQLHTHIYICMFI